VRATCDPLLDKTGTITLGNRQASEFVPGPAPPSPNWPTRPALLAGRRDAQGRSIVVLAKRKYGPARAPIQGELANAEWIAFTAQTRMSGVDVDGRKIRKGAAVRYRLGPGAGR